MNKTRQLTANGNLSFEQLKDFPVTFFDKRMTENELFQSFGGTENIDSLDDNNCTLNEECTKNEVMAELLFEISNRLGYLQFGSFIRNFVGLSNFDSLSLTELLFFAYFGDETKACNSLKTEEKNIHQYFADLSQVLGFDKSEQMSLYDIPGINKAMVVDLDILRWGNDVRNSFIYSRCQDDDNDFNRFCEKEWEIYSNRYWDRVNEGKHFIFYCQCLNASN